MSEKILTADECEDTINGDACYASVGKIAELIHKRDLLLHASLRTDNARLKAEVEGLRGEWISVKDRMPKDGKAVLVWKPDTLCHYMATWNEEFKWWSMWGVSGLTVEGVTHWKPLGERPTP